MAQQARFHDSGHGNDGPFAPSRSGAARLAADPPRVRRASRLTAGVNPGRCP